MNEQKQQLILLFESRDPKRRKKLYQYYQHYFDQQHSVRFTLALINADLGVPLITRLDIKYIRANCQQWRASQIQIPEAPPKEVEKKSKKPIWTNQEELKNPSYTGSKLDSL